MLKEKITLQEALKCGEQYLTGQNIADAAVDAWLLLEYVTGIRWAMFLAERSREMRAEHRSQYEALLVRRGSHIPLQHLTGEQEFMGFPFRVNRHVLVPRQDTETLAEEALKRLCPGMRVLDLCTGSGCIAISLAKLCPGICVDASDLSAEALEVARENGQTLEVQVQWIQGDLFENVPGKDRCDSTVHNSAHRQAEPNDGRKPSTEQAAGAAAQMTLERTEAGAGAAAGFQGYDMIVSNPPYIRTSVIEELSEEVRLHEPYQALDGREDGLFFYRKIIREAAGYLKPGGWLMFEIGHDQAADVTGLLQAGGYVGAAAVKDLAGLDRVVIAQRAAEP